MTTAAASLSPTCASLGLGHPSSGKARRSHPRESSGAYQLFDAKQVQVFREAFSVRPSPQRSRVDGGERRRLVERRED